jgi:hypothetical protein
VAEPRLRSGKAQPVVKAARLAVADLRKSLLFIISQRRMLLLESLEVRYVAAQDQTWLGTK